MLRVRRAPTADELPRSTRVRRHHRPRRMEVIGATPQEVADDDHVDLARVAFRFDRHGWARLRILIDRLNHP